MEKVESSLSDRNATRGLRWRPHKCLAARVLCSREWVLHAPGDARRLTGTAPAHPIQTGARRAAHAHLPARSVEVIPVHLLQPGVDRVNSTHLLGISVGRSTPTHLLQPGVEGSSRHTRQATSARRGGLPYTSLSQVWVGPHAYTPAQPGEELLDTLFANYMLWLQTIQFPFTVLKWLKMHPYLSVILMSKMYIFVVCTYTVYVHIYTKL